MGKRVLKGQRECSVGICWSCGFFIFLVLGQTNYFLFVLGNRKIWHCYTPKDCLHKTKLLLTSNQIPENSFSLCQLTSPSWPSQKHPSQVKTSVPKPRVWEMLQNSIFQSQEQTLSTTVPLIQYLAPPEGPFFRGGVGCSLHRWRRYDLLPWCQI